MATWLKQSTAATVKIGPFIDDSDGVTAETGLTIQKADVRLTKNGGDMAAASADQGVSDAGAAHDEAGWYDIALDATDTGTLGRLKLMIAKTGALPVWEAFMVIPANVFDSLVGGSDSLEVDAVALSGDTAAADNLESALDGTGSVTISADIAGSVASVTGAINTAAGTITTLDALDTAQDAGHATTQAAISTLDGKADAILLDTAEIGAAGAGLTAVPWNSAWDAEVQSEATDALAAYDPPTRAEATADKAAILAVLGTPVGADLSADIAGVPVALLDLADGVETGLTMRGTLRLGAAVLAGKVSGAGTGVEVFRAAVADHKVRVTATVTSAGNRSTVTTDTT